MIVCMTHAKNMNSKKGQDGLTDIERFMEAASETFDALVFFDNNSTDGTADVVGSYGDKMEMNILRGDVSRDKKWFARARALEHCRRYDAEWVFLLKPNEVLEHKCRRGGLHSALVDVEHDAFAVKIRHLCMEEKYYRVDSKYLMNCQPRIFRCRNSIYYGPDSNFFPGGTGDIGLLNVNVLNYKFLDVTTINGPYKISLADKSWLRRQRDGYR